MSKKAPYPVNPFIRIFVNTLVRICVRFYGIKKKMPNKVKNLKAPYLLLANHVGHWDPFVIANQLPSYTQFVSSDAAFRNPVNRFFLKGLGIIPKMKNVRDTKVIRDMAAVINSGRSVGIFPEAVRNWAGKTSPLDPSIVKLVRFLQVPVVTAVMRGMHLAHPRWAYKYRRTYFEVEYDVLLTAEEIPSLSDDEIFKKVTAGIHHDEMAYQNAHMHPIYSNKRAEHIGYALYVCPECRAIDSFNALKNDFECGQCGYHAHVNTFGFFESDRNRLHFDNIRDWFYWQEKVFVEYIQAKLKPDSSDPIFVDDDFKVYKAKGPETFKRIGTGKLSLYKHAIILELHDTSEKVVFDYERLKTINPQVNERLEIFYEDVTYRLENIKPGVSGLKWEYAASVIWKNMSQKHKLAAYLGATVNNRA